MTDEYIRKVDAVEAIGEEYVPRTDFERGMVSQLSCDKGKINALPSADVAPVVRCENCKYCIVSRQGRLYCIHGFEQTLFSAFSAVDNPIFEREFDSFCSYGERREDY